MRNINKDIPLHRREVTDLLRNGRKARFEEATSHLRGLPSAISLAFCEAEQKQKKEGGKR